MSLNVLYLTNNAGRASTTIATKGWIEHLHVRGLRATIVSPIVGEFADWAGVQHGVASYRVDLPPPSKMELLPFLRSIWKLRRIVGRHQIDIIHSNEQVVYPTSQYLARLCRLPIVVGVHSRMERGFASWAFGGRRGPDRLIFLTAASREVCRPAVEGIVPEATWRILPNGLDVESSRPDSQAGLDFRRKYRAGRRPVDRRCNVASPGQTSRTPRASRASAKAGGHPGRSRGRCTGRRGIRKSATGRSNEAARTSPPLPWLSRRSARVL